MTIVTLPALILPPRHKSCAKCGEVKPFAAFYRRKKSPWYYSWCKACFCASRRGRRRHRPSPADAAYRRDNRERLARERAEYAETPLGRLVIARSNAKVRMRRNRTKAGKESARLAYELAGREIERFKGRAVV